MSAERADIKAYPGVWGASVCVPADLILFPHLAGVVLRRESRFEGLPLDFDSDEVYAAIRIASYGKADEVALTPFEAQITWHEQFDTGEFALRAMNASVKAGVQLVVDGP